VEHKVSKKKMVAVLLGISIALIGYFTSGQSHGH
jgi:zinc and cadmium transporter